MKVVQLPCRYIGVDIAPSVIEKNRKMYLSDRVDFKVCDGTSSPLPQADTILCREVLFHLSFSDCWKLIKNMKDTGARYLLCTTDPSTNYNPNIPSGAWRDLNMYLVPFGFSAPMATIEDGQPDNPNRIIAVWELSQLRLP